MSCQHVIFKDELTKSDSKKDEDLKISKNREARKLVAHELYDTERNYVKLLGYVLEEYKSKLEESQLISNTDCKQIFGNLPELKNLHNELEQEMGSVMQNWDEKTQMGALVASYCSKFLTHYPPYINFLDQSLQLIKELQDRNQNKIQFLLVLILTKSLYLTENCEYFFHFPGFFVSDERRKIISSKLFCGQFYREQLILAKIFLTSYLSQSNVYLATVFYCKSYAKRRKA